MAFWLFPAVLLAGFVAGLIVADIRGDRVPAIVGLVCAVAALVVTFAYVTRDTGTRTEWWLIVALASGVIVGVVVAVWWATWWWLLVAFGCAVAGGLVFFFVLGGSEETAPLDPHPGASSRIVAIGDSYIAGEGAPIYFPHTDERSNRCHRAATAHPYLVADELGASLTFAACSGARTFHLTTKPQFHKDPVLGDNPQIDILRRGSAPTLVLLSIGGNDAGFAEIGAACATPGAPACTRSAQFWVNRLEKETLPKLEATYRAIRLAARGAPVFALTYPNPVGPRSCSAIELSPGELAFVRDVFVRRLDQLIRYAAARAQIRVIDLQGALAGKRFCDEGVRLKDAAVNFVALGRTRGTTVDLSLKGLAGLAHGTFHPNVLGHDMLEDKVRPVVERALKGKLDPLPERPGARPPEFNFDDIEPPVAPESFPPGTDCGQGVVSVMTLMSVKPDVSAVALRDLRPGSRVCYRRAGARWRSADVDADGTASVPVVLPDPGIGSVNEVLAQEQAGAWRRLFVTRVVQEGETLDPPKGNYVGLIIVLVLGGVGFVVAVVVRLIRRRRAPAAAVG